MRYHGTLIVKTCFIATVYKNGRAFDLPLYRLEEGNCKDATESPRLTSIQECKDYILEKERMTR